VSIERVGFLGASLTVSGGSLYLDMVLLLGTCVRRCELLPTPLRGGGGTQHVQALRKELVEVPNLSKGEICSNYSLSICP
jgi:hypothetical protein